MVKQIIDLPDGWTCIECGDEYLKDTEGQLIDDYTEGTLCKKCNQQASRRDNMKQYIIITDDKGKKHTFYNFYELVEYIDSFTLSFLPDNFSYEIKINQQANEQKE